VSLYPLRELALEFHRINEFTGFSIVDGLSTSIPETSQSIPTGSSIFTAVFGRIVLEAA
jgi:hypothetical protein